MENRVEDKYGIWELSEDGISWTLIEPSDLTLEEVEKPYEEPIPQPTLEDYMMDLDYRLSLRELGL